jgi:hypothetical protein
MTSSDSTPTIDIRSQAKKRLKAKADFKQYLGIWAAVSLLLVGIWAVTSYTTGNVLYFWPIWPFLGMGIAAFFMGLEAYGPSRNGITEADIDAEVERMQRRSSGL